MTRSPKPSDAEPRPLTSHGARETGTLSPLWSPTESAIHQTRIHQFTREIEAEYRVSLPDYAAVWEWSVKYPELFWSSLWKRFQIIHSAPPSATVVDREKLPGATWFPDARLNFAENLLSDASGLRPDEREAIIFQSEDGSRRVLTYGELRSTVSKLQQYLQSRGVGAGDRVAGFLPNIPETVAAMLATTSLGAIWSSTSPDFGPGGVIERFSQILPKVLFTTDRYLYNGRVIEKISAVPEIIAEIPSIEEIVVFSYDGKSCSSRLPTDPRFKSAEDLISSFKDKPIFFEQLPFDHPLYILYSSGTTGKPKCIVHGAGGTLLQHLKELALHTDLHAEEKIFYFTTCGWMMWNWLVSSLAVGSTIILFDGSPFYPNAEALWNLAAREGVSVFGTSAKYLAACEKAGVHLVDSLPLPKLRTILSTGSPLPPSGFEYVYSSIKSELCLSSISGGTDIISCFALGNPTLPVRSGELQCRGLGMDVAVFDETGSEIVGEKGELVCKSSFPSMPIYFWNDPNGEKYRESYFSMFPNIWRHGDWIELTESGGIIIYGRSDTTLNPGGIRIGTAEIYRQVEQIPEVLESLVTGQEWENDERVVLFVKLRSGVTLDDALRATIRQTLRNNLSPRHVPERILQVDDIPRTVSGKITELAVKNLIHGRPVKNQDALANPESLVHFKNRAELAE